MWEIHLFCFVHFTQMDTNHTNISPCHFTACLPSPIRVIHRLLVRMYAVFFSAWRSRVGRGPELCSTQETMAQSCPRGQRNGWVKTRHWLPGGMFYVVDGYSVRTWSSQLCCRSLPWIECSPLEWSLSSPTPCGYCNPFISSPCIIFIFFMLCSPCKLPEKTAFSLKFW